MRFPLVFFGSYVFAFGDINQGVEVDGKASPFRGKAQTANAPLPQFNLHPIPGLEDSSVENLYKLEAQLLAATHRGYPIVVNLGKGITEQSFRLQSHPDFWNHEQAAVRMILHNPVLRKNTAFYRGTNRIVGVGALPLPSETDLVRAYMDNESFVSPGIKGVFYAAYQKDKKLIASSVRHLVRFRDIEKLVDDARVGVSVDIPFIASSNGEDPKGEVGRTITIFTSPATARDFQAKTSKVVQNVRPHK